VNVNGVNQAGAAGSTRTGTAITDSKGFIGKDDFFKILSAQLKYQDPLEGGDNNQYIMQMSNFAMIEKLENLESSIQSLFNLSTTGYAVNLIGKTVTMDTKEAGEVTGRIEKLEITGEGIHYWIGGTRYEYPAIRSIGEDSPADETGGENL